MANELPVLYALMVGIDRYKSSNVPSLRGCEADATQIAEFIKAQYANAPEKLHLAPLLLSEKATRQAIIDGFRQHLAQAPDGATVYFHYSGHGSTEKVPMDMMEYTPDSQNQTIVCHDSRTTAEDGFSPIFDLADKELAVLIQEVGKDKPNLHIILSLDCCHSGGGSREGLPDDAPRKRQTGAGQQRTDLKQYIDGYYSKQWDSTQKLSIPAQSHVLFSACSPTEVAWESEGQGMFTRCFLEILRDVQNPFELSYGEIFDQIQIAVRQKGGKQTPQVEAFGTGNMWRTFLSNQDAPNLNEVKPVFFDAKTQKWLLKAGALDGLKALPNAQEFLLELQTKDKQTVGKATLGAEVRLETSSLENLPALDTKLTYYASIAHLPQFQINAYNQAGEAFDNENQLLRQFQWVDNEVDAHYKVEKNAQNEFCVVHLKTQKIIGKTPEVRAVYTTLAKIGKWETLQALQNPATQLKKAAFKVAFETFSGSDWTKNPTNAVQVSLGDEIMGFKVHINNQIQQELHVALLLVSPLYGIYSLGNTALPAGKDTVFFDSTQPDALPGLFFMEEQKDDTETDWFFQCIVSTGRVNEAMLEQDNFSLNLSQTPDRSEEDDESLGRNMKPASSAKPNYPTYDWFTETIQVHLTRETSAKPLQDKGQVDLGNVLIENTEGFTAEVTVNNLESASRGISNSTNEIWKSAMQNLDLQIVGTKSGGTRSTAGGQEIITLTNINGTVSEDKPLRLTLKEEVKEDEIIVSFANVGGVLIPVGYSSPTDRQKVEIFTLPEDTEKVQASRGILGSIGIALYKVIARPLGFSSDNMFWLRKVDHEQDGDKMKVKYTQDNDLIRQEVGKAGSGRILLVIHGILGSTDDIALFAHELVKRGKYDLVLAYDYENLNESIRGIADHLQRRLIGDTQAYKGEKFEGVGISKDKKIDIIAHSMGGLVSRFMIEQLQGSEFVNRLIMCGTPNGGSNFGLLNKGRKFLSVAGMIGLQFFAPISLTGWLLGYVKKVASGSSLLFNTLGEMERDSEFLRQLNVNGRAGNVPYYILAGDIHHYKPDGVTSLDSMVNKALAGVGDAFNAGEANDIAVLTSDIKQTGKNKVSAEHIFDIPCHHLNYFTEPHSVQKLIELLG